MSSELPRAARPTRAPRVFLSYSHDSREHQDRVLALADRLHGEGIDAVLDQYEEAPKDGWPRWMGRQVRDADYVLVLCTAGYRRRFDGEEEPGKGLGASWEGAHITQALYEGSGEARRFLPVIFAAADRAHIPAPLRALTFYELADEAGYETLYRRLTSQPEVERPDLGALRELPPRARRQDFAAAPRPEPAAPRPAASGQRKEHVAWLSYAHRYQAWVEALHRDLERTLRHHGEERSVLLDPTDLAPGRSWVTRLQKGLEEADHLVLVATPEAFAAPRTAEEHERFAAARGDAAAARAVVLARLHEAPLPPQLEDASSADFRGGDGETYLRALGALAGALLGRDGPVELPAALEPPEPPGSTLPDEQRRRLVEWLAPLLASKFYRRSIAVALRLERGALEGFSSHEAAASAALALATGDDDPLAAARRVADVLAEELGEDEPEKVAELRALRQRLEGPQGADAGLLGVYLERVRRRHSRLVPYFEERGGLDLIDRVYVQLDLRPELAATETREKADLGRPASLLELLRLEPAEHPWVSRRWVVRGDPGSGKTTLLRHLAASLAGREDRPWVPVFASLPRLLRDREWLLDRLARSLTRAGHPARSLPAVLEREGGEGRLLVLLDGLDEVPRDDRQEAEDLVQELAARWPRAPLVVATRPIGYRRLGGGFVEVDVLPLDRARRLEFLARWIGRRAGREDRSRAEEALRVLETDRGLWELSGNPLYLTLMALLLEEGRPPDRNRPRLYEQVFALLLEGRHRPDGLAIPRQAAARAALRHLAFGMTQDNRDAEPLVELESRLYAAEAEAICADLERVPPWRRNLRIFLEDVADSTGILGPHDGPDADWRYWHRTFREALAAEQLEQQLAAGGRDAVLEHARAIAGDESRWAEPYALLAGRVAEADELVSALVRENRSLGLRAVATAQGLAGETLAQVLELSGDWQERAKVYLRLPELVGEADRALALLDRLRQRTHDGNDLYFLERALDAAAARWPEQARQVEALRGRFYDHIPPPDAALFREVETARDGVVHLWCEVAAGTYRVGSPPGEGDNDEHPQHDVVLAEPFGIAAVSVTNAMYAAFDSDLAPHEWKGVGPEEVGLHPRVNVTWFAASAFCRWLGTAFPWARGARLPSEEEWEIACRAGTTAKYWSGDSERDLERVGWYTKNSGGRTHRVGEKEPNPWGLYDVHGNVREWTLNRFANNSYEGRDQGGFSIDPREVVPEAVADPASGVNRVIRGGSFRYTADGARSAFRDGVDPWDGIRNRGFRVLLPFRPELLSIETGS